MPARSEWMLYGAYGTTGRPDAGHMVHFDHPDVARSIVVNASAAVSA